MRSPNTIAGPGERARQLPLPAPLGPPRGDAGLVLPPLVLTIGHSNLDAAEFVALLHVHRVRNVIDVRSAPYSRYAPHFSKAPIEASLTTASIAYCWLGDSLGGRPTDPACYRDGIVRKGNVNYRVLAQHPRFQSGLRELVTQARAGQVAIMCSEEDPRRCHRHRLIEPALREHGVEVMHIRRDGSCEAIRECDITSLSRSDSQLMLTGFA